MRTILLLLSCLAATGNTFAATEVRVDFTLNTTAANGAPLQQNRYYYLYRPDNLPKTTPVPVILVMEAAVPTGYFHRKADQAGFVEVGVELERFGLEHGYGPGQLVDRVPR